MSKEKEDKRSLKERLKEKVVLVTEKRGGGDTQLTDLEGNPLGYYEAGKAWKHFIHSDIGLGENILAKYMGMTFEGDEPRWQDKAHTLHYDLDQPKSGYLKPQFSWKGNWMDAVTDKIQEESPHGNDFITIITTKGETMVTLKGGQFIGKDWFHKESTKAIFEACVHWVKNRP